MAADNKAKILRDAERYVLQGKTSQAIAEYIKIVKNDPNDVLTLNTIGDLYLRQGKIFEANNFFSQVAENYTRNNFFLKAIAVYRKILNADPQNLAINQTLASLYAKQGLNVDARNQFLRVAELCAREGKTRESLEAYEKVVELDPMNYAVQVKLAEIYLGGGSKEKAQSSLAGAARAQAKAGDLAGATKSYLRAMQLNPVDVNIMKGFLDACIQLGDVAPALDQLKKSLVMAPDNIELREMLGRAYLAARDPENAAQAFQMVVSTDESRFPPFFDVQRGFVDAGDFDSAALCLDAVVPILIRRRLTDRAVEGYNSILAANPGHVLTWTKLANVYAATNDQCRHLEILDKVVDYYLSRQSPQEALEYLEQILQISPDSAKHLKLHQDAFAEAFPGLPYTSPIRVATAPPDSPLPLAPALGTPSAGQSDEQGSGSALVEVDLLLNYGMKEKALELLRTLESRDPSNKEVRQRLLLIYMEERQPSLAAEQCLLLAIEYRRAGDEEAAQKSLAEARRLDPALVDSRSDLLERAQKPRAASDGSTAKPEPLRAGSLGPMEVDLTEDLSEFFFRDAAVSEDSAEVEAAETEIHDLAEEFTPETATRVPEAPLSDQLQEVDFYIRLGFYEEARAKLDEIAKDHPNSPELPFRYRQIAESVKDEPLAPRVRAPGETDSHAPFDTTPPREGDFFHELKIDQAVERFVETHAAEAHANSQAASKDATPPAKVADPQTIERMPRDIPGGPGEIRSPGVCEGQVNAMFADLIEEVNSLTDQDIAREDFENHFSLGIAYREMNLVDEAIKEFQGAVKVLNPAKSPKEMIQCCGMLSTCFLEKGMPRSAIRWCEAGLSVPEISRHEAMALRYDMGVAFSITGDLDRALVCFDFIYGSDPSYRDVAQRIDELKGGSGRHAP